MDKCVMAIDGWVCKTRQPTLKEVGNTIGSYRNRKQCWAILVLAGCDSKCRFNMFSAKWSGSTHDHSAWETSAMKGILDSGRLPEEYHIIGDEAFVNTNQLLIPWSGTGLGDAIKHM